LTQVKVAQCALEKTFRILERQCRAILEGRNMAKRARMEAKQIDLTKSVKEKEWRFYQQGNKENER